MKKLIIFVVLLVLVGAGIYAYRRNNATDANSDTATSTPGANTNATTTGSMASTTPDKRETVIGKSVEDRDIVAYHYGSGTKEVLFIGGIHGGYSGNTVLVARELVAHLEKNESTLPANIKVTVIPLLNPDGLYAAYGTTEDFKIETKPTSGKLIEGRFNAHDVDLNRNFECEWKKEGVWQSRTVSGGKEAFSEPETAALRDYTEKAKPVAVIAWYSAAGGVYASSCSGSVSAEARDLTNLYAKASGYAAFLNFDFYEITGDMVNWFAKMKIPAISVLLTTHESTDWDKNLKGIEAVIKEYSSK